MFLRLKILVASPKFDNKSKQNESHKNTKRYRLTGKMTGKTMSGTFEGGLASKPHTWVANKINDLPLLKVNQIANADVSFTTLNVSATIAEQKNTIISRGICYGENPNPNLANNKIEAATNSFKVEVTNLRPNTTYYLKAYAVINGRTVYSDQAVVKKTLAMAGTTWAFKLEEGTSTKYADVTFNADGTAKYDETPYSGTTITYGSWSMVGTAITYARSGTLPSSSTYVFSGNVKDKAMAGNYTFLPFPRLWSATLK